MSRFTLSLPSRRRSRDLALGAVLTVSVLTITGCAANTPTADDGTITVVASTSVYGDLVSSLGGDAVSVTSLIESAAQDPHSYEASARDQLAVSRAELVVINGGGYDPFAEALYEAAGASAVLVKAVDASGLLGTNDDHEGDDHVDDATEVHTEGDGHNHIEGFNEHVWYSFHAMENIAKRVSEQLATLSPENSDDFEEALAAYLSDLEGLEDRAAQLAETSAGRGVAVTEPVAVYLLEAAGLNNLSPADFTEAIEEGADVPPTALRDVLGLLESGRVVLLAYNEQTASPETERVRLTAVDEGVPVVMLTETLPEATNYVQWMSSNLDAIAAALAQ